MLITIIIFIAVLSLLVFVHELGHFVVAKKMGVKVEEFGFGFPPRVIGARRHKKTGKWELVKGKTKEEIAEIKAEKEADKKTGGNGGQNTETTLQPAASEEYGTIYSLNWVPIGGFVKLLGQDDFSVDKNLENQQDPRNFQQKKSWQRALILAAGVAMNFLLCAVLLSAGYVIGLPQLLDDEKVKNGTVQNEQIQIMEVLKESPAEKAGLRMGDVLATIDGREFKTNKEIQEYTSGRVGVDIEYAVKRGDEVIVKKIQPEILKEIKTGGIGVALVQSGLVSYPWHRAVPLGFKATGVMTVEILKAFGRLVKNVFSAQKVAVDIAGPVGIAVLTGQVAKLGFVYLLQFTALLSLNLAIINFFPFPALDGGHLLFLLVGIIKRKPVNKKLELIIHNIGFALLMALILLVTARDVFKFWNPLEWWERLKGLF